MTVRRSLTALAAVLALLLAPTWASALWSATATGPTSAAAATMRNATGLIVACTSAAATSPVLLTWTASPDTYVTGYQIVRTAGAGGLQTTVAVASTETTYTDAPPVGDGLTYSYGIRARAFIWATPLRAAPDVVSYTAESCSPAPVQLPAAADFSVLAGAGGVTSTGATTVSGDLGIDAGGALTGFPPGLISGATHLNDAVAAQAQAELASAYDTADQQTTTADLPAGLDGTTLLPGVHHSTAAVGLTGTLTLDAGNDPNARFVIQVDAALNTAAASVVLLINGALPANVVWQVQGAVGLGAGATFVGTVLAAGAITLGDGVQLVGRALSYGAVTLTNSTIRFTSAPAPTVTIAGGSDTFTSDITPTITGTTSASTGANVTVTIGGQTLTATAGADGAWTVTAASLTGGAHPVRATVRDAAGNAGTATQTLTVEVSPEPVALLSLTTFAVVAGTGGLTSTGSTVLDGDVAVAAGQVLTGSPQVNGTTHLGDGVALQAGTDRTTAYDSADARTPTHEFAGDLDGRTFRAGVHHTAAALALTGTLTLDGQGDPNAVFIIQVDAALNTGAGSTVALVNGAGAANVVWQVAGAAGIGANATFVGTILANGGITVGAGSQLTGRALSQAAVTLAGNRIG